MQLFIDTENKSLISRPLVQDSIALLRNSDPFLLHILMLLFLKEVSYVHQGCIYLI